MSRGKENRINMWWDERIASRGFSSSLLAGVRRCCRFMRKKIFFAIKKVVLGNDLGLSSLPTNSISRDFYLITRHEPSKRFLISNASYLDRLCLQVRWSRLTFHSFLSRSRCVRWSCNIIINRRNSLIRTDPKAIPKNFNLPIFLFYSNSFVWCFGKSQNSFHVITFYELCWDHCLLFIMLHCGSLRILPKKIRSKRKENGEYSWQWVHKFYRHQLLIIEKMEETINSWEFHKIHRRRRHMWDFFTCKVSSRNSIFLLFYFELNNHKRWHWNHATS